MRQPASQPESTEQAQCSTATRRRIRWATLHIQWWDAEILMNSSEQTTSADFSQFLF